MLKKSIYMVLLVAVLFIGCGGGINHFILENPTTATNEIFEKIQSAGTREDYPNAETVTIERADSVHYDSTGMFDNYIYSLSKILTMREARSMSEISIGYDNQVMDLQILYVRVIKPDGTVLLVSESDIVDETMPGFSEMDVYWDNLRQKTINLPRLEMNDAVEMAIRFRGLQPYFHGIIGGNHGFQSSSPVLKSRAVVTAPSDMPLEWKVYNDPDGRVSFQERTGRDGITKYEWIGSDFPQVITEPGVQPSEVTTMLLYSSTTWEDLSRAAYDISEPMMHPGPEILAKVDKLLKDAKTERDTVMILHYYVAQEIRYIGVSLGGMEGITPHDVNETFAKKGGVCKDKSALLTVMLEYAGVEVFNALTNPMQPVMPEIATNQFNHMVVVATLRDGEEIFLDVTDEFCMNGLPGYYSHRGYLPMSKEGIGLKFIDLITPEENKGIITANTTINEEGTLSSTVTIEGNGIYDMVIRQLRLIDRADMDRLFERMTSAVHPSAELKSWKIEPVPLSNLWVPGKITIEYEVPDYAIIAGDYILMQSPLSLGSFDLIAGVFLSQFTSLETREHPFEMMFTLGLDLYEEMQLAGNYVPRVMPEPVSVGHDIASVNYGYTMEDNVINFNLSLRVNDSRIPVEHYDDLRDVNARHSRASDGQVILVREGGQI